MAGCFLEATYPDPETAKAPRYADGSGSDEVTYRIDLPDGMDASRLQVPRDALLPGHAAELFCATSLNGARRPGNAPASLFVQPRRPEGNGDRELEAARGGRAVRR